MALSTFGGINGYLFTSSRLDELQFFPEHCLILGKREGIFDFLFPAGSFVITGKGGWLACRWGHEVRKGSFPPCTEERKAAVEVGVGAFWKGAP